MTIKSVLGRNITDRINGVTEINLPLCGGAETLTLTLPEHYFNSDTNFPITSYLWGVPPSFTVVGGQPATVFGPNNWLSGRSITIQVPAGQFDELVAVKLWSRECEGPNLNPPATQTSNPQYVRIRRTLPTITTITSSRPSLNCGDQRPLTLTANTSQPGANSFTWTLPAGWIFVPGTPVNTASVSVVPNGNSGGQPSATATYNCVGYTTRANNTSIGYDQRLPAPTTTPSLAAQPGGVLPGLCGPLTVTAAAVGATEYYWSATNGILVNGASTATVAAGASVTLTPPPNGTIGRGTVTVESRNPAKGCQPGSTPLDFTFGAPPVRDLFDLQGYCFDYAANGPSNTFLVCPGENLSLGPNLFNRAGQSYEGVIIERQWTISGGVSALPGSAGAPRVFFTAPTQPGRTFTVTLRLRNDCGQSQLGTATFTTLNADGGEQPYRMGPTQPATAYPNPADGTLTLEQPAGTPIAIYNSQGRAVYKGRGGQRPTRLNTRAWPEGIYYLVPGGPAAKRQQLIIKH